MLCCMMNEPAESEIKEVERYVKLLGLMMTYRPRSQYVWCSEVVVSQFITNPGGLWC